MAGYIRLMHKEDVSQVAEIDREAFPTMWPPLNFEHELHNRLSHYLVACDGKMNKLPPAEIQRKSLAILASLFKQLLDGDSNEDSTMLEKDYIKGFAGLWILGDEAHLMSIAVREKYRRQGLGELLLVNALDYAREHNSRVMTLEVRISNTTAQKLYQKYDFREVGIRRAYYVDNKEDAVIMTTSNLASESYKDRLSELKEVYTKRWGPPRFGGSDN